MRKEQSQKLKIELAPYGTADEISRGVFRGWKCINVNGETWGTIMMFSNGQNGARYQFRLGTHSGPMLNDPTTEPGGKLKYPSPMVVYSDSVEYHRWLYAGRHGERPKKLHDRLIDAARLLIEHDLLVSPAEHKRHVDVVAAEAKRATARRDAERRARWKARINRELCGLTAVQTAAVIRLMEWSQSQ